MPTTFFLLFGLMSLGFAAFTYFMFDIFIFSNYRNAKRCTERTEGVIIRYSYALYNGISLPVVEYTVDGNQYKVLRTEISICDFKYNQYSLGFDRI